MKENPFTEIIARVENVRKELGLNKTKFSRQIGLKPQTYNNFVGSQGSKPNVALIKGVIDAFQVDSKWLLTGEGPIFEAQTVFPITRGAISAPGADRPEAASPDPEKLRALWTELDILLRPYRTGVIPLLSQRAAHTARIRLAVQVLTDLFHVDPWETAAHVLRMLADFQQIVLAKEAAGRDLSARPEHREDSA